MRLVYADRHISPFEGSPRAGAVEYVQRGDVIYERYRNTEKTSKYKESNIRYIILLCRSCMLTITSPPLKGAGGMLYTNDTGIPKKHRSINN